MFSKISALAFISAVSAAPTPIPDSCTGTAPAKVCTDFPKYKTANAALPAAGVVSFPVGYFCIRNNYAYTWPVNRGGSPVIAAATPADGTAGSAIKAFYGTSADALGTMAAPTDTTTTAT